MLTELADGLASPPGRAAFVRFVSALQADPNIIVVPATQNLFTRGLQLYQNRPDKAWTLTECISFIVMEDRQITEALTGDHHFEQAGFVALLR